jgi:hypothetical protein
MAAQQYGEALRLWNTADRTSFDIFVRAGFGMSDQTIPLSGPEFVCNFLLHPICGNLALLIVLKMTALNV